MLGGTLAIARTWSQGRWWVNPAWAPLNFELDPLGRDVKVIERAGTLYERSGQSGLYIARNNVSAPVYIRALVDANSATQEPTGWQWYDRLGNTIDYDETGRIQGYANPSGVKVSFAYDSATTARILDHFGATALTATLANGLITKVQDQAGRSVSYEWGGPKQTLLTQVTDVMGQLWKYEYDGNGQITTRTDPLGANTVVQYVQSIPAPAPMLTLGAVGTTLDPSGTSGTTQKLQNIWGAGRVGILTSQGQTETGQTSYLREKRQFEVTLTDKRGNTSTITYDLEGTELSRTFNGKAQANLLWDGDYLSKQIDARGNTTTTRYDTNRQPLQIIYPDGSQETYTYEPVRGQKTSHTNALGTLSTWSYDAKGRVTQWVEAKGLPEQRTTSYTYDQYGQLTSKTSGAADGQGQDARTQTWQYDAAGNVQQATDPAGRTTKASYDQRGLPTSQTDALGRTTQLTFNAAGSLTKSTNALNQSVQHQYDARQRRTQTTTAAGKVQKTRYDQYGRVIETLLPGQLEGAGTRIEYDAIGQAISTTSPSGLIAKTEYDERGRVKTTTDPAGNTTSYTYGNDETPQAGLLIAIDYPTYQETYGYDQRGRQTTVTQKLSKTDPTETRTQSTTYDAIGQRVASTDPAGRTTLIQYDALGHLTTSTDPLAQVTQQSWSAHDQLLSLTDAKGNQHQFEYDKAGQLVKETRPLGGAIALQYDAAGQLTQRTDAGGNTRAYSYDQAGRMTQEAHKLAGTTTDETISYSYDADGQMTAYEQKDASAALISSASYTRDAQGRTTQSAITYGKVGSAGSFSFTLGQGFNADGQLQSHTYPDGSTGSYSYDKGQLSQITLPNNSQVTYQNYQWMVPTSIQSPGAVKTLTLDALQRPISIAVKNSTSQQLLASRNYQYDKAGNITQINSDLGETKYGYDGLDRLTQAAPDQNLQSLGLPVEQYGYDPVHNRTSSAHQPGAWSYNADNQLTQYPSVKPFEAGAPAVETQVTYTAQGHTKTETNSQSERTYGYNAAERLTNFTSTLAGQANAQIEANYRYDPFGRRISKAVKEGASTKATYFANGDSALLGEFNEQGVLTKAYGFHPVAQQQGLWSTEPVWQATASNGSLTGTATEYQYLQTDHMAAPMLAITNNGVASWKSVAESFGTTGTLAGSTSSINLRLPGQYFDEESGVHYNYLRDYKPALGRYVQSDPIGIGDGGNLFSYARQNALSNFDSTGEWAFLLNPTFIGVVGIIVGGMIVNSGHNQGSGSGSNYGPPSGGGSSSSGGSGSSGGASAGGGMESRNNSGKGDPVRLPPVNPGRDDCTGKCNPCPPGARWFVNKPGHGHENGYWHVINYNQDPETCMCWPDRPSQGLQGL